MKKLQRKFKLLSLLLVAGLLFTSVIIPVKAFIQKPGTVKEAVTLRQNPDNSSGQVMELAGGQTVTVNNELTGTDGAAWYQIFVNNGTTFGYVPANTVTINSGSVTTTEPMENSATTTTQTVTVTEKVGKVTAATAIRVRMQASTSSEQIASMLPNADFLVLSEVTAADGYVWYQAEFDDNGVERRGYVRSDLVEVKEVTRQQQVPVDVPATPAPSDPADTTVPYSVTSQKNIDGTTVWYLMDNNTGETKEISSLLAGEGAKSGGGIYKIIVVVLLLLLVLAAVAATFFYMRWRDAEDFIAELREKQARSRRQPLPVSRPNPINKPVAKQAPVPKPSQGMSEMPPKPVTKSALPPLNQPTAKPVEQVVSGPETKIPTKPASQPVSQPISRPIEKPIDKPVVKKEDIDFKLNTADIIRATKMELQNNQAGAIKNTQSGGWKSKNFLTDDDDLEFDFLDMDDK